MKGVFHSVIQTEDLQEQSPEEGVGCRKEKMAKYWRKFHNEELHNFIPRLMLLQRINQGV